MTGVLGQCVIAWFCVSGLAGRCPRRQPTDVPPPTTGRTEGIELLERFRDRVTRGGASCAVVQGGPLAGAVARRPGPNGRSGRGAPASPTPGSSGWRIVDDARPAGVYLLGQLASRTLLGALLVEEVGKTDYTATPI